MIRKIIFIMLFCSLLHNASAGSFDTKANIKNIMTYAKNTNYDANDCVLYFESATPSQNCSSKTKGLIKSGTEIGKLMCSMALMAFMSGKSVTVASHDDCDPIHGAPILRYLIVN